MNLTCPNCTARFKISDGALGAKGRKVKCGKCEHRWHAMPEAAPAPAVAAAVLAPAVLAPAVLAPAVLAPAVLAPAVLAPAVLAPAVLAPADPTEDFTPPPPPPPPPPQVASVVDEPNEDGDDDEVGVPVAMLADPPPIPPESSFVPRHRSPEPRGGGTLKYWILLVLIIGVSSGAAFGLRDKVVHHFPAANKVFMIVGYPANTLGYGLKILEPKTFLNVEGKKRILGVSGQIMNETGKIIDVPLLKAILIGTNGEDVAGWSFEAKAPRILPGEKVEYETATENPPQGATGLRITFTRAEEEAARKDKMMLKEPAK